MTDTPFWVVFDAHEVRANEIVKLVELGKPDVALKELVKAHQEAMHDLRYFFARFGRHYGKYEE